MNLTDTEGFLPATGATLYNPCVLNNPATPNHTYRLAVRCIDTPDDFLSIKEGWQRLEVEAIYPNIAYGYTYLTTAIKHLATSDIKMIVVEKQFDEDLPTQVVGIVPFQEKRILGLPLKAVELWKHDHCFDTTPLLAAEVATEAWKLACQFLFDQEKVRLISLDTISAEPAIEEILRQAANEIGMGRFDRASFERAALRPTANSDDYKSQFWSKSMRRDQRKLERRLGDRGQFRFEESNPDSDFAELANDFLRIEDSGWKGEQGTSLKSNRDTESFYHELIELSARNGNVRFVSLVLEEKRIGMLLDLRSAGTIYSYKSAYDHDYKDLFPGKLCEMKNVELLHQAQVDVADSCTAPDNQVLNRIWGQKLKFQRVVFAANAFLPKACVKLLPTIQSLKHKLRSDS